MINLVILNGLASHVSDSRGKALLSAAQAEARKARKALVSARAALKLRAMIAVVTFSGGRALARSLTDSLVSVCVHVIRNKKQDFRCEYCIALGSLPEKDRALLLRNRL